MASRRNLKVYNSQRLQTGQVAASVPVSNPGASRSRDALQIAKRGTMSRPGKVVASPVQGRFINEFNSATNNNARLGHGITVQYPVARVVPALRDRFAGSGGHPVISRTPNSLQKPGGKG